MQLKLRKNLLLDDFKSIQTFLPELKTTPRYLKLFDQAIVLLIIGIGLQLELKFFPMRIHADFLTLISKSSELNSPKQMLTMSCNLNIEADTSTRSSAYIKIPKLMLFIWQRMIYGQKCFYRLIFLISGIMNIEILLNLSRSQRSSQK